MGEAKQIEAEMRGYGAEQEIQDWPSDAELEFDEYNEPEQSADTVGECSYATSA